MARGGEQAEHLRIVAATPARSQGEQASHGFHRSFPERSARYVLTWTQALALLLIATTSIVWARVDAALAWRVAHVAAFAFFSIVILFRVIAAANLAPLRSRLFAPRWDQHWPIYTLLCPLHREANVVFDLVAALNRLDYPKHALDVQLLVEADDPETIAAALAAASSPHIEVVVIPPVAPRTKPKALNVGLARARGEFLAVYDAEDRPHPAQLRAALAAFADGGGRLACVQAPLVADNGAAAWIARQFAAEYAIQFQEVLPSLARVGLPLPLGGTSNHFRVAALRDLGGWDPYNVTEDADLGYRIARQRLRSSMIAPPTWEEAPVTSGAWLRQRTRWIKGHLQTWLVLMRDPFATLREMGLASWLSMHVVLGGGVAAAMLYGPLTLLLALTAFTQTHMLSAADVLLAVIGYVAALFAGLSAAAITGDLNHARAALTMPLYWFLTTVAAAGALLDLALRPHHWAKTRHGVSRRARFPFVQTMPESRPHKASTSASG